MSYSGTYMLLNFLRRRVRWSARDQWQRGRKRFSVAWWNSSWKPGQFFHQLAGRTKSRFLLSIRVCTFRPGGALLTRKYPKYLEFEHLCFFQMKPECIRPPATAATSPVSCDYLFSSPDSPLSSCFRVVSGEKRCWHVLCNVSSVFSKAILDQSKSWL